MKLFSYTLFILFFLIIPDNFAQEYGKLRGFVTDSSTSEALPFGNVLIESIQTGASTNERGLYLINNIPANHEYEVLFSYIGYESKEIKVFVKPGAITELSVSLSQLGIELQTIEKIGEKIIEQNTTDISLERIAIKELEILPKGVETDVFRSLQYIPGVQSTGDVSARYYVRGSTSDQNLVLLNGVTIYNPFHSMGLFSVFDPDIINNMEFYKGGFPSEFSGRLSSVMSILTKDGNKKNFGFTGSASLLTAKGLAQGPLPNGSFLFSFRKSHSNQILKKFLNDQTIPIDFYDAFFRINYSSKEIFNNAKFVLFGFFSNDKLDYSEPERENFKWSNNLIGFEWLQVYDTPLFSRLELSLSNFNGEVIPNQSALKPKNNELNDFTLSFDLNAVMDSKDELNFGIQFKALDTKLFQENSFGVQSSFEKFGGSLSIYGKYKVLRHKNLGLDIGTRYKVTGFNPHGGSLFEPRIGLTYVITPQIILKGAWGIYIQELTAVSDENEIISLFEPWIIIPDNLKPASGIHYIGGVDLHFIQPLTLSIEAYYKIIHNLPIINNEKFFSFDPDLIAGSAESYGWEFMINYEQEPVNITLSYALSWAYKTLNGFVYYPKYDSRNIGSASVSYNLGSGWLVSSVFSYSSGLPFTEIIGYYDKFYLTNIHNSVENPGVFLPYTILGDPNIGRLPDYHRLDFALTKKQKLFMTNLELSLNIINAYDRKNIFYFERDTGKRVNMLPFLVSGTVKVEI